MKWYGTIIYAIGTAFAAALAIFPKTGHSTWKPEYAQNSPEVNQWYKDQQMTEETWRRLGSPSWHGCCEKGDVFRRRLEASVTRHNPLGAACAQRTAHALHLLDGPGAVLLPARGGNLISHHFAPAFAGAFSVAYARN